MLPSSKVSSQVGSYGRSVNGQVSEYSQRSARMRYVCVTYVAFLTAFAFEGIEQERVRSHEHATMRELRALRTEVAQLRAKRQAWLSKHVSAGASK